MAKNFKIELSGYLGSDPKIISKNGKHFVVLSVATTDSYPVKDEKTGDTKWKDKETQWHEIWVFRPSTAHFARDLKKGDAVEINCSVSYRTFKEEGGFTRKQASFVADFIEKMEYNRQDTFSFDEAESALAAQ
ncbi:MAG: single-stranded DNA-binding protein [Saprospiraceae bacterium]